MFDAAKTLEAITSQKATVLVATHEQAQRLVAELAADTAKPESKRAYNISSVRTGLLLGEGAAASPFGAIQLRGVQASKLPSPGAFA